MTIHLLVEGPSERAFFEPWARRALHGGLLRVHPHQGKGALPANARERPDPRRRGLLDQLPAKLRAFGNALDPVSDRVVVLVDADDEDPEELAAKIDAVAKEAAPALLVAVRLAVEETEAFYLGDLSALARGYPDADMALARTYEPDSICGTWELFGRVVGDGGGNKVSWAETMGPLVTTNAARSRSPSFKQLVAALKDPASTASSSPSKRKKYRHPARGKGDPSRRR